MSRQPRERVFTLSPVEAWLAEHDEKDDDDERRELLTGLLRSGKDARRWSSPARDAAQPGPVARAQLLARHVVSARAAAPALSRSRSSRSRSPRRRPRRTYPPPSDDRTPMIRSTDRLIPFDQTRCLDSSQPARASTAR